MITIKEVAKAAGVSPSTVSRALSGDKKVNEKTRQMIEKFALELNYTPNFSARALIGKRSNLVGLIVPEIRSNYYVQMIDSIESVLSRQGYTLIVSTTGWNPDKGIKNLNVLVGRKVDGVLYADEFHLKTSLFFQDQEKSKRFPLVVLGPTKGAHLQENPMIQESLMVDEGYGIALLVNHLMSLGHRSLGYIGEDISSEYRLPLFRAALAACNLPYNPNHVKAKGQDRFEAGGYLRMKELLMGNDLPTAVFASYDYLAIGAIKAAHEAGLKVPDDISIVGFDNIRESEYLLTPLTTVYPPIQEMAQRAVEILIEKIEGGDQRKRLPTTTIMYPELIVRQSSGAPREGKEIGSMHTPPVT